MIRTHTNYIAKDINVTHAPTSYTYSPSMQADQDIKWKEGIWSTSSGTSGGVGLHGNLSSLGDDMLWASCPNTSVGYTSYIGEEYNSLDYLHKSTEAKGLNEMSTEASFSGQADYEASVKSDTRTGTADIGDMERYVASTPCHVRSS